MPSRLTLIATRLNRPAYQDAGLAMLLFGGGLFQILDKNVYPGFYVRGLPAVAVLAAGTLPLAARRRWPAMALAVMVAAALLGAFFHIKDSFAEAVAGSLATYTVVNQGGVVRVTAAVLAAIAANLAHVNPFLVPVPRTIYNAAFLAAILAPGFLQLRLRRRGHMLELKRQQVEQQNRRLAELAIAEERASIAGELQWLVLSGVDEVVRLARSASRKLARGGKETEAIADITVAENAGRNALVEMRRLLGVLTVPDDQGPTDETPPPAAAHDDSSGPRRRFRFRENPLASPIFDVVLALAIAAASAAEMISPIGGPAHGVLSRGEMIGLAVVVVLPLVVRRRFPLAVLVAMTVMLVLQGIFLPRYALAMHQVGELIAVYTVTTLRSGRRWVVSAAALGISTVVVSELVSFPRVGPVAVTLAVGFGVYVGIVAYLGRLVRQNRDAVDAIRSAQEQLEAGREGEIAAARIAERLRIAREMHDAVGHGVSVMVVQAGAARTIARTRSGPAREALKAVVQAGSTAVKEMESVTGLWTPGEPEGAQNRRVDRRALETLVREGTPPDMKIDITVEGRARTMTGGLALSAYRIVQEGITNLGKHGSGSDAAVSLRYSPAAFEVEIVNGVRDKPPATAAGSGHGLVGMRERVAAFGGEFLAHPTGDGRFRVRAVLPWQGAPL
jgi:signal transduction histidine kinase